MQAVRSARLADTFGYVGVAHDVQLPGQELFFSRVHLHGGPPRCAASCPNWSTSSSASRSIRARSSTSSCR